MEINTITLVSGNRHNHLNEASSEGYFTIWLSIEQTKNYDNSIRQEQKLIPQAFTLEANNQ
jgi:hypothetical protein